MEENSMKTRNLRMRLLSLALCVCMVLGLLPAVTLVIEAEAATNNVTPNYITDIGIAYATRKSNAQNLVTNNGFTLIDRDLNEDAGGKYIYMGYKTSTDPSRAITGMLFRSGKNPPSTVSYGGATFYLVGGSYEGNGTGDGAVDLNDGAGGDYIYTYITRDTNYGYPILWMDVSTNVASGGFITVPNTSGSAGDVNAGTGDQSLYVYYKTFETIGGIDAYTGSDSKVYLRYRYLQTDGSTTSVTRNGQLKNHKDTYYYTPSVPQSVTWSGYSMAFAGWKYAGAIVEKPYGAYSDNSSSGTRKEYTAVYTGNVTVTYDANGGTTTPSAQTIAVTVNGKGAGDKAYFDMPTEVITNSNGCKYFLGWSSNKNAASAQYTAGQKGIEFKTDTTLYAVWENHHDGNGDMICDLCQTALSAPTTVNGIYQISNKNQLIWFMQYVNAGNKSASAVLTADIDMGGYNWTPIASTASYHESGAVVTDKGYTGTFDGAGYVIKNFTVNGGAGDGTSSASGNVKSYGLFGTVSGTVKNLGIDGFTFNVGTADCRAGAIVGQLVTGGRIEDCYVINSKVLTGSRIAGAIAGCNYGGTIDSCFAYNCEVTGHARCAAVVGDTKDDGGGKIGTVTNCYADKNPVGSQNGGSSYVTNCATLTAGQISSGEAAWMLNGNSSDGVWKQTVGSGLPSFVGGTVYQVLRCDGKTIIYSNSSANPQAHTYSNINGLCTFCGAENPNVVASVFKRGSIIGVYTRLETAISMVERSVVADMAVVQLQKNVDLGGAYQKIDGGVFTIDLNGYEISNNSRTRETLSIAGSGTDITIISSRTGGTVKNGSGNAIMGESSTNLTVTGIRVIAAQNGMRLYGNATLRDLTVESMNAEGYGISVQGADLTLTLTNCTVTAAKAALYITGNSSTVIVNGGSFNGGIADIINLGKVVLGEGTIFPGGISVDYTTLKAILGEGMAYWQGDKMIIPAEDATQITGGDVVIKAECMHPGDKTYTNNVGDHSWSCEDCNNTFTEAHSYTNCVCVCGAVSPDAEASVTIGGKASYYATLNDAIAVAQNCSAADQAVVTILKDIDLGDDYQRINGGVFTFDLNGFELSSLEDYWGVFVLRNGADITIIDSRGDGKITGVFYGIEAHDSTVTISGGTISGQDCGVYVTGCTVTISGGTISGQTYGVYAYNNSDVTISGGTIIGKGYDLRAYKSSVFKLTVGENGVGATFPGGIKVYGTTLNAILGEGMAYWQGNKMIIPADEATQITGGDVVIKAECMHPGDKTYTNNVGDHSWNCEDCNNTFTEAHSYTNCVCVCGAVSPDAEASVTIGGKVSYYATLNDAIRSVKNCTADDNAVVTILKDINLGNGYQQINGGVFTFDLNGFEVSASNFGWGVLVPDYGADITITDSGKGGKITGAYHGIAAYDSTVTISGGTITGVQADGVYGYESTVTIIGGTISGEYGGVRADNSTVEISGGTISGRYFGVHACNGTVTISDGTITGVQSDGVYGYESTVTISGGTLSGENCGVSVYNSTVTIIGGTISGASGIHADGGTVEISGGTITGGCGVSVNNDCTLIVSGGTITGVQADGVYGCESTVTIIGGTISGADVDIYSDDSTVTLTVGENGVGATFPGGISVGCTTLKAILGEGTAYWQGNKMIILAEGATEITGGDVVIKAECKHPGDKTYTDNGDDHTYTYTCCGLSVTEVHTFVNGQCLCGKLEHKHNWSYQDNGDGTHTESCTCDSFVVEHVYENGVCICGALPAASVTMDGVTMCFRDLDSAIHEARYSTSKTTVVKLLQDIDLGDGYQEIYGSVFTFDLNGFELSSLDDFWGVLVLRNGADITIIDSREGGKITSAGYSIEAYDSTVTISGGTISGQNYGVYVSDCTVTISGGTISGQSYGVYAYNNSDVTISGGTIIGKTYDLRAYKSGVFKLTVGENGVGATFPGGIKVYGTTLNAILGEGAAYWQGNQMIVPAEGATEITGGDVVIKAPCTHSDDSIYFERYSNEFHQKTCSCGFINELEEHRFGSDFVCDVCGYDKNVITITMTDDWGDGWNGNGIYVYKDGVLIGTATIMTGRTDTWSCPYDPDAEYEFYWQRGGYPEECSFEISIAGETVKKVASRGCSNYREGQLLYPLPLYSGWTELDGKWYYYDLESHEPVTGIVRVPYPTAPINGITYGPNPEDVAYFEGKGQTFVNKDTGWFWFNYDGSFNYYQNGVWHHDVGNHSGSVLVVNGMIPWHVGMVAALGGYYYFIGDETNGANKYAVGDVYITRNTTDRDFVIGGVYTFDEYGALCEYNGITEVNGVLRYYEDARLMLGNGLTKVGENYIYVRSNGELVVDAEYYILPNDLGIAPGTYTFDENGFMVEPISSEKNGVYFENGSWYYYENGKIGYNKGLIHVSTNWHFEDGSVMGYTAFIYVRSSGKLATGDYYITNVSNGYGLFSAGQKVNFSEDGMAAAPKNGIYEIDGVLYYFVNNQIQYNVGLMEYNGGWIYVRSNGALATGKYWITNTGGAMEAGYYEFGDDGYLIISDTEDGIVFEGENLYYYLDGKKQFGLGLTKLEDGTYIYVRTNGELAVGSYWITNHNGLLPEGMYEFGEDGILTEN